MNVIRRFLAMLMIASLLAACDSRPVADHVSLEQANEIVAFLSSRGIEPEVNRESGGKGRYTVTVPSELYAKAAQLLHENQIPKNSGTPFSELIEQRGLMPNSREIEALRLDHARSVELKELLEHVSGVASAQAIVRSSFPLETGDLSVAVVIQQRHGATLAKDELVRVVSSALPGVRPERIELAVGDEANQPSGSAQDIQSALQQYVTPFIFGLQVRRSDYLGLIATLLGSIIAVAIVSGFFGYRIGFISRAPIPPENQQLTIAARENTERRNPALPEE